MFRNVAFMTQFVSNIPIPASISLTSGHTFMTTFMTLFMTPQFVRSGSHPAALAHSKLLFPHTFTHLHKTYQHMPKSPPSIGRAAGSCGCLQCPMRGRHCVHLSSLPVFAGGVWTPLKGRHDVHSQVPFSDGSNHILDVALDRSIKNDRFLALPLALNMTHAAFTCKKP